MATLQSLRYYVSLEPSLNTSLLAKKGTLCITLDLLPPCAQ